MVVVADRICDDLRRLGIVVVDGGGCALVYLDEEDVGYPTVLGGTHVVEGGHGVKAAVW